MTSINFGRFLPGTLDHLDLAQQVSPSESWETREAAVGGPPFAAVFHREGGEVGIGRVTSADV